MNGERLCPCGFDTTINKKSCGAKIVEREPLLSGQMEVGQIYGPRLIKGSRTGEDDVPYYVYKCEKGHLITRPDGWAKVPTAPPGTMKTRFGYAQKTHAWFSELPEEEKKKRWK